MSIAGYFSKRGNTELRMPQSGASGDALSIRYEGPVLSGKKSVQRQQRDDAIRATGHRGEVYKILEGL